MSRQLTKAEQRIFLDGAADGEAYGRHQERRAVVAWLREQQWTTRVLDIVAGAIERGEHLGAADE